MKKLCICKDKVMFIEVLTKDGELILVNVDNVFCVFEVGKRAVIIDVEGIDLVLDEDYMAFRKRLLDLKILKN